MFPADTPRMAAITFLAVATLSSDAAIALIEVLDRLLEEIMI